MTFRRTPYVDVTRAKCHRCGKPPTASWSGMACAGLPACHVALCTECDIESNVMIMEFLKVPGRKKLIAKYAALKEPG